MNLKKIMKITSRRNIVTLSLIVVIFVMSLGYAALSQYTDIEGVAIIDRSWIIKVKEVTNSVTNNGVSISNPYVGTTVTMTADLPSTNSMVTYTIKLENQGNLKAKLHSIEKIEDDNSNITYTINGVEEGVTTLNPGEINTVTVTIKAKDGIESLGDTEKRVMLAFNYVENSVDANGVPTNPVTYDEYGVGDEVNLVDGSLWYVVKDSNSTEEYVTIISYNNYGNYAFDTSESTMYDPTKSTNIGYAINNTILPNIKTTIDNNGGNSVGTTGRLLTLSEYNTFIALGKKFGINQTWLMTENNDSLVSYYNNELTSKLATEKGKLRIVIITLKENVSLYSQIFLAEQIKLDNVDILTNNEVPTDNINSTYVNNTIPGIDFSVPSSDINGKGLYKTSDLTKTEDIDGDSIGEPVYYFRGAAENNFVKFGEDVEENDLYWRVVRINEDGSIRMMYYGIDVNTATSITVDSVVVKSTFESSATDLNVGENANECAYNTKYCTLYRDTNVQTTINSWYDTLGVYKESITNTGFCNDTSGGFYSRRGGSPIYRCEGKIYDSYAGLLSADELMFAGINFGDGNASKDSYLSIGTSYSTMTQYNTGSNNILYFHRSGYLKNTQRNTELNVFPVINLDSNVSIANGDGTTINPYVIKID